MRTYLRIALFSLISGIVIAFAVTVFTSVRGKHIAMDRVAYLYPGDTDCGEIGMVDIDGSAKWLETRYQKIEDNRLVFDWGGIAADFVIRVIVYFIISLPVICYIINKKGKKS